MKKILCWLSISNFHYDDFIYSGLITLGKEKSKKKRFNVQSTKNIFCRYKKIKLYFQVSSGRYCSFLPGTPEKPLADGICFIEFGPLYLFLIVSDPNPIRRIDYELEKEGTAVAGWPIFLNARVYKHAIMGKLSQRHGLRPGKLCIRKPPFNLFPVIFCLSQEFVAIFLNNLFYRHDFKISKASKWWL